MSTSKVICSEATISDTVSDNETNSTNLYPISPSVESVQTRDVGKEVDETADLADGELPDVDSKGIPSASFVTRTPDCTNASKHLIFSLLKNAENSCSQDKEECHVFNRSNNDNNISDGKQTESSLPAFRGPALKREKSHSDTIERKKKRVKFSSLADELISNVHPSESQTSAKSIVGDALTENSTFSTKLKKLLRRTNKKSKPNLETQTSNSDDESPVNQTLSSEENKENAIGVVIASGSGCENLKLSNDCDTIVVEKVIESKKKIVIDTHVSINSLDNNQINDYLESSTCDQDNSGVSNLVAATKNCNLHEELKLSIEKTDSDEDSNNSAPKREGTFTLDGSPPPKQVKSSYGDEEDLNHSVVMIDIEEPREVKQTISDTDNKSEESSDKTEKLCDEVETQVRDAEESPSSPEIYQKKSVAFFIGSEDDLHAMQSTNISPERRSSILKRQRPISFEEELIPPDGVDGHENVLSHSPASSISTNSSETMQSCLPKSSVSNIGCSAKRTIATAWKNAITRQDSLDKPKAQTKRTACKMNNDKEADTDKIFEKDQSKDNLVTKKQVPKNEKLSQDKKVCSKNSVWSWRTDTSCKQPKNTEKIGKQDKLPKSQLKDDKEDISEVPTIKTENSGKLRKPKSKSNSIVARASSWSGMSLSVPHVKRENTFMKNDAKKYDSEKERLQNEVIKLNVEKERMMAEMADIKGRFEEEVSARRSQRRSFDMKIRQIKDDDQKKLELQINDLRNRLEGEKREAVTVQKDVMARSYETEIIRNNRGRDEETRRLLNEARLTVERLQASLRREALKDVSHTPCHHHTNDRELEKLTREVTMLKDNRKKLEENIQTQQAAERVRVGEIRRVHEQHESQLSKILKTNKQEATRLLEEIKSKDRTIGYLEKKVNRQDAKIRQQEEKGRASGVKAPRGHQQKEEADQTDVKDGSANDKENGASNTKNSINKHDEINNREQKQQQQENTIEMAASYVEIERLKQIVEEQQQQISTLIQQSIDRETQDHQQMQQVWPLKRESCLKASELPTVLEQASEDLRERKDNLPIHGVQPFRRCISLLAPSSHSKGGFMAPPINWANDERLATLESTNASLEAELQEARDHADLLEFRILEFTEGDDKSSERSVCTIDQGTSTCDEDLLSAHLHVGLPHDDLSLPLSIDSGLDLSSDTKARISEGKTWLAQLAKLAVLNSEKTAANSLASLLEWLATLQTVPTSPIHNGTPTSMSPTAKSIGRMGAEDHHPVLTGGDLTILAARLQETLADPSAQESALVDTIAKLRVLDSSLGSLQSRVTSLTEENRELQDAITALSEAHETRTEASGTESEIVHRKTPSLHSDLSDAESESDHHQLHHHNSSVHNRSNSKLLTTATSLQESGIFDASCDCVNAATQTNKFSDMTYMIMPEEMCHSEDSGTDSTDVDLKSAVARLASIRSVVQDRDLRAIRLQELQESDEYLKSPLEGDRVSISKLEYDSIVDAERQLQHQMEMLKTDRDDLSHQCQNLKDKLKSYTTRMNTDAAEMLRGELKVLSQRLEVSERCRRELFEEKCELEEAENDARLMVQRFESQLDGAREMESLLSASLSQEQELSREMQRKYRDLQMMEKDARMRHETLEHEGRLSSERMATLTETRDALASQLSFAAYGLLIAQMWKRMESKHMPSTLVPCSAYSALTVSPFNSLYSDSPKERVYFNENIDPKDDVVRVKVQSMCDVCIQTNQNELVDRETQATVETSLMDIDVAPHNYCESSRDNQEEQSLRRTITEEQDDEAPAKKRLKSTTTTTRSQSTMTHLDELLSEREKYYLEQIESLQKEKMSLRKDQDVERSDSLQHHTDLESEMKELQYKLEVSERDKCNLIFRLEEIEDSRDLARRDMQKRLDEIKGDMNRNIDLHNMEKAALQRGYEARLKDVLEDHSRQELRVRELEQQLNTLRHELEAFGGAIASDLVELDAGDGQSSSGTKTGQSSSKGSHLMPHILKAGSDCELLDKIRDLVKSESSLRQKIGDLEKKESAYRETIEEADTIMSSHVTSYTRRIEELERVIEQHMAKIHQLEASEERLRGALRSNSRTSEGERITQLLDRIIEIENSELKLKERVWGLERTEKELQIKLVEAEKVNQSLRSELRDQEELVHRLMTLQTENNLLSVELQQAHDSARKLGDVQQSESYFRGRVEELEATENTLREALHQADILLVQRERRLKEQNRLLEEELHSSRSHYETSSVKAIEAREIEVHLRRHVEDLRSRLQESEKDLKDSSSENMNHETQHRSEVMKLRNQLKLVNAQLTDLDGLNCALRDRVTASDNEKETMNSQLDERIRRHEQDVLSLNLQISNRDSKVEELEGQLQQLRHTTAVGELDALAATPLSSLHSALALLTTTIQTCELCSKNQSENLSDITHQLGTLSDLLEGHCVPGEDVSDNTQSDLDTMSDMEDDSNKAENLVTDDSTTPPPILAEEGTREHTCEENEDVFLSKELQDINEPNLLIPLNRRDSRRKSRRRIDEKSRRRLQMPSTTGSVLDELEEKVRELEEVIGTKDEELKLADGEAAELNSRLLAKDEALLQKTVETNRLDSTLSSLREQLMCTIEDYERSRLSLEMKHKVDVEEVARRMEHLTEEVEKLVSRGRLKDTIIATLVAQIRALLRSGNMSVVINQLQNLSKVTSTTENSESAADQHQPLDGQTNLILDFDIDTVCGLLKQPHQEMQ